MSLVVSVSVVMQCTLSKCSKQATTKKTIKWSNTIARQKINYCQVDERIWPLCMQHNAIVCAMLMLPWTWNLAHIIQIWLSLSNYSILSAKEFSKEIYWNKLVFCIQPAARVPLFGHQSIRSCTYICIRQPNMAFSHNITCALYVYYVGDMYENRMRLAVNYITASVHSHIHSKLYINILNGLFMTVIWNEFGGRSKEQNSRKTLVRSSRHPAPSHASPPPLRSTSPPQPGNSTMARLRTLDNNGIMAASRASCAHTDDPDAFDKLVIVCICTL